MFVWRKERQRIKEGEVVFIREGRKEERGINVDKKGKSVKVKAGVSEEVNDAWEKVLRVSVSKEQREGNNEEHVIKNENEGKHV